MPSRERRVHAAARCHMTQSWARRVVVDDGGNLVVRTNFEEVRVELVALVDVDPDHAVFEARFPEHDVDLLAVRRGRGVEVDHDAPFSYAR